MFFRKKSVWWVRYDVNGSRVVRSTGCRARREAETYVRNLHIQMSDRAELHTRSKMTLQTAVARYVDLLLLTRGRKPSKRIRRNTRNEILRTRKIEEFFGHKTPVIDLLQPHLIGEFNYYLLHQMKPGSANRYLSQTKAILNRAYEWGAIPQRPAIRLNKDTQQPFRALNDHEESALLRTCPASIKDFVTFILDTGARKSEALDLTWDNVDLQRQPRPVVHFLNTKSGQPRTVPLPLRTAKVLQERREMIPTSQRFVFIERARKKIWHPDATGRVYAQRGNWIPLSGLNKRWIDARTKAGLPGCRMHDLRHTYASKLVRNGVSLLQVCRLLGHSDVSMTMRYSHLAVRDLDDCVAVLDYPYCDRRLPSTMGPWLAGVKARWQRVKEEKAKLAGVEAGASAESGQRKRRKSNGSLRPAQ
jgi:integrase